MAKLATLAINSLSNCFGMEWQTCKLANVWNFLKPRIWNYYAFNSKTLFCTKLKTKGISTDNFFAKQVCTAINEIKFQERQKNDFDPKYKHISKPGFWLSLWRIFPTFLPWNLENRFCSILWPQNTLLITAFMTEWNDTSLSQFQMSNYFFFEWRRRLCHMKRDGAQCCQILVIWRWSSHVNL